MAKVRLQWRPQPGDGQLSVNHVVYSGALDVIVKTVRSEGFFGLFAVCV